TAAKDRPSNSSPSSAPCRTRLPVAMLTSLAAPLWPNVAGPPCPPSVRCDVLPRPKPLPLITATMVLSPSDPVAGRPLRLPCQGAIRRTRGKFRAEPRTGEGALWNICTHPLQARTGQHKVSDFCGEDSHPPSACEGMRPITMLPDSKPSRYSKRGDVDRTALPEGSCGRRSPPGGAGADAAHPLPAAVVRAVRPGGGRSAVRFGGDATVRGHRPGPGRGAGRDDGLQVPSPAGEARPGRAAVRRGE